MAGTRAGSRAGAKMGRVPKVGFPFGNATDATAFPMNAAQGIGPGWFAGFGWTGWAIAFFVLFIIGFVFWRVWGSVGPLVAPLAGGFFW